MNVFGHMRRAAWMAALGLCWLGLGAARGTDVGRPAPPFLVISGDGREMSFDLVRGKAVALLYETRETVEINRPLKDALQSLWAESEAVRAGAVALPVIDCSSAVWPLTAVWRAKLRENSEKERRVIYGDWDGRMAAAYGFAGDTSTVVLIDPKGVVRYRRAGQLSREDIGAVSELLRQLAGIK